MKCITTVTLNPAIDKTLSITGFELNKLNRVEHHKINAGGKGINTAVFMARCGFMTIATGFVGGETGKYIENYLLNEGVAVDFVHSAGNTRQNIKVADVKNNTFTDINESGLPMTETMLAELNEKLTKLAGKSDVLAMGGSLLPGCSRDIYAHMIEKGKKQGAFTALDAGGVELSEGIRVRPDVIKPNKRELEAMVECELYNDKQILTVAREIVKSGVRACLVTLGAEGAIAVCGEDSFRVRPLEVSVASTVGCGDAFMSGYLYGVLSGADFRRSLALAASFATAKIQTEGTDIPVISRLLRHVEDVIIERL